MYKKTIYLSALIALFILGGCVHVVNLEPSKPPTINTTTIENVAKDAQVSGNQSDIVALAKQIKNMLVTENEAYNLQQVLYVEQNNKGAGSAAIHSEERRKRYGEAIPINWKLGDEANKLYQIAKHSRPDLSSEGMALAKTVLSLADTSDVSDQFSFVYVLSGMESNSDYLGSKKEGIYDTIAKKRARTSKTADALMKKFIAHLSKVQTSGAQAPEQFAISDNIGNLPVKLVLTGGGLNADKTRMLKEDIEKALASTSLANRQKQVTIYANIADMDSHTVRRYMLNSVTFFLVGYFDMGSGGAEFSAFVQNSDGKKIPLDVNSYEIGAKDTSLLTNLVALRVVGRAQMTILREDMK